MSDKEGGRVVMIECPGCGHGKGMHQDVFEYINGDTFEKRAVKKCRYLQGVVAGVLSGGPVYCGCLYQQKAVEE